MHIIIAICAYLLLHVPYCLALATKHKLKLSMPLHVDGGAQTSSACVVAIAKNKLRFAMPLNLDGVA